MLGRIAPENVQVIIHGTCMLGYMAKRNEVADGIKVASQVTLKYREKIEKRDGMMEAELDVILLASKRKEG